MSSISHLVAIKTDQDQLSSKPSDQNDPKASLAASASNELILGVVGHVGSGTSEIADVLKDTLIGIGTYEIHIIKARKVITDWAELNRMEVPDPADKRLDATQVLQNYGDEMRKALTKSGLQNHSAVAVGLIREIKTIREKATRQSSSGEGVSLISQDVRRVYILDALRHPAEVYLLRRIYQEAFVLVGVVCEESKRQARISEKYENAGRDRALEFMQRDAKAREKYGQRVADTFHLSDFFVDNTSDRFVKSGSSNPNWDVAEKLSRLVKIVTHSQVVRPEVEETAMNHAYGAMMQSACLSRQVGAALIDPDGDVLATGTNEVPKGGGGVYGEPVKGPTARDRVLKMEESRCALRDPLSQRFCSNTVQQNEIIDELIAEFSRIRPMNQKEKEEIKGHIRDTRVGGLLEFSRAVHAEMDALLTAGRTGSSTVGTRLFVTVFPCHYCARHIVTAGVDEVQYIEPYPKSKAVKLHEDAIEVEVNGWLPPSKGGAKVLFRPFSGVAPRLYKRAFLKDRDLKDSHSGAYKISPPEWGEPWYLSKLGYTQLEDEVIGSE
jgi:deoxycytidylate deaminase